MRRSAGLLLALACVASCDSHFVKPPPARFRHAGGPFTLVTYATGDIARVCAGASTVGEPAGTIVACTDRLAVRMPDPCEWHDPYAQVLCHELAHAQGWGPTHED